MEVFAYVHNVVDLLPEFFPHPREPLLPMLREEGEVTI